MFFQSPLFFQPIRIRAGPLDRLCVPPFAGWERLVPMRRAGLWHSSSGRAPLRCAEGSRSKLHADEFLPEAQVKPVAHQGRVGQQMAGFLGELKKTERLGRRGVVQVKPAFVRQS
jgi:hypothetical protein